MSNITITFKLNHDAPKEIFDMRIRPKCGLKTPSIPISIKKPSSSIILDCSITSRVLSISFDSPEWSKFYAFDPVPPLNLETQIHNREYLVKINIKKSSEVSKQIRDANIRSLAWLMIKKENEDFIKPLTDMDNFYIELATNYNTTEHEIREQFNLYAQEIIDNSNNPMEKAISYLIKNNADNAIATLHNDKSTIEENLRSSLSIRKKAQLEMLLRTNIHLIELSKKIKSKNFRLQPSELETLKDSNHIDLDLTLPIRPQR